jgi:disulfide bond formation protein DsbB
MRCSSVIRFFQGLSARAGFVLIGTTSAGLVGCGLVIGELMRLNPCPLCIFQRILYLAVALVAFFGAVAPKARRVWGGMVGLVAAGGLATAIYQSWLQLYPEAATQCGFGEPNLIEQLVDWLGMQWPFMFMATGFCTSKEYILGLTMANWSIVCFSGFLLAGIWAGWRSPKGI